MPKHLRIACIFFLLAMLGDAILTFLYEPGARRVVTPLIDFGIVAAVLLFTRRAQWTWRFVQVFTIFNVLLAALFFPTSPLYAQVLTSFEIASGAVIAWSILRRSDTKAWFFASCAESTVVG